MMKGRTIALIIGIVIAGAIAAGAAAAFTYNGPSGPMVTVSPSDTGGGRNLSLNLDESIKLKSN